MRIILICIMVFLASSAVSGETLTASWYSVESCLKEGTSGIMANGRKLDDSKLTAASWDHAFGTRLKVTNIENRKSIIVTITDRGPAKRLYRQGRVLDLSKAAFSAIAEMRIGVARVKIEEI